MISWIQRTFQQHFKWLFLLLLGTVIVSFVFITNVSGGFGQGGNRRQPPRPFFGLDLSLAADQRLLADDARLSVYLRFNPAREVSDSELSNYALNRHATLVLADQLGLPAPTEADLLAHIRTQRAFADPATGNFDPKRYAEFTDSIRRNPRLTEGDVSRVITADTRLVAYEKLLAGPGYVLPSDVAEILAGRDTTWTLAVASLDGTSFDPRIDTSDTALVAWFETNARRYEVSPRVVVAAIRVSAKPLASTVVLTDAEVRAAYDANPSRYPAPPASTVLKLDPSTGKDLNADDAFKAVRALVESDLRKQRAVKAALGVASDLNVQLFEQGTKPADLPAFIANQSNAELVEIGAVGADSIPAQLGGASASSVATEALRLSAERPYSNPVTTPDGAAILVWRESIPAHTSKLADVRERALTDYKAAEKRRLFNEAGQTIHAAVAAAVAAGKSFESAVSSSAASAGLKSSIKKPEPFTLSGNFPRDLDYTVLTSLESLSKGKVGEFLPVGEDSGRLVYVVDKQTPAVDPTSADYTRIRDEFAANIGRANATAIVSGIVAAETAKSEPVLQQ